MHELLGKVAQSSLELRASSASAERQFNQHVDHIIKQKIDLPESLIDDRETRLAESLHSKFWENSEQRTTKLRQIYKELSEPEDLIVMICCKGFCVFLEFWLKSCEQNNIAVRDKTLVFTLDAQADSQVNKLGLKSYLLDPSTYKGAGGSENYGDRNFNRTMFYKNAAILESLKLGANILFQDVDLIWLKDPLIYLKEQSPYSQIQIMYDGENQRHFPFYANTGFFYLKNEAVCLAVLETALHNTASIFKLGGHQAPFNRICHHFAIHNLLNLCVLPESLFLNGHLFNADNGLRPASEAWQESGIVIHYSWTANRADKIRKLEKFNYFNLARSPLAEGSFNAEGSLSAEGSLDAEGSLSKVSLRIDGMGTVEFYADPNAPVLDMLRDHLDSPKQDELIYLNYGDDDTVYFMSSKLLSIETEPANRQ
jgi:hypothetical protein